MKDFNENIKKVVAAINSAPPEQYTFVCESAPKHDGTLDAAGDEQYGAKIEFFDIHPPTALLLLSGGYGTSENAEVYVDPKQALSLLAWLRQEEETLTSLAKEQSGDG